MTPNPKDPRAELVEKLAYKNALSFWSHSKRWLDAHDNGYPRSHDAKYTDNFSDPCVKSAFIETVENVLTDPATLDALSRLPEIKGRVVNNFVEEGLGSNKVSQLAKTMYAGTIYKSTDQIARQISLRSVKDKEG